MQNLCIDRRGTALDQAHLQDDRVDDQLADPRGNGRQYAGRDSQRGERQRQLAIGFPDQPDGPPAIAKHGQIEAKLVQQTWWWWRYRSRCRTMRTPGSCGSSETGPGQTQEAPERQGLIPEGPGSLAEQCLETGQISKIDDPAVAIEVAICIRGSKHRLEGSEIGEVYDTTAVIKVAVTDVAITVGIASSWLLPPASGSKGPLAASMQLS